jgi:hypothetical protein
MKPGYLSIVLVFFLLAGCGSVKVVNHPKPDLKVDFSPFEDAGCPLDQYGFRRCQEESKLYSLGCDFIQPVSDLLGGLTPPYPMAECTYRPYGHTEVTDPYKIPESEYFFNVGGPMPELVRYVVHVNGEFKIIKNPDEFRAMFSPVETPDEALSFSMAMKNIYASYDQKIDRKYHYYVETLDDSFVEKIESDYIVHAFAYQFFGCGPHYTYALDVKVTVDGQVEEISRTKIFNDPAKDDLCQD